MPDEEKKTADTETAVSDDSGKETFTISKEEWDKTQKTLIRLEAEKRVAAKAQAPKADDDETKTQKQKLEEMQASMRTERERLVKKARRNGIREAIAQNGITDPDAVEVLFDHVEARHGLKIQVGEDDEVSVLDDLGESKSVSALIGDILKSPKGKHFKIDKVPGPNTRAGRGNSAAISGQKSYMEMSLEERLKLTPEQERAATKAALQGN